MNEKQKAKAYDEALEQAKKELAVSSPDSDSARQIFRFFPQLKETEDEKVRKALIEGVRQIRCKGDITQEQMIAYLEKQKEQSLRDFIDDFPYSAEQKEQKPVDKFQEYLNASPAERRKMNMDEILGDNKGHQKTSDALTTDSNKEADTSDCKYKNLDEIAQDYVDGVKEYNPELTWDLIQTAVCYGYHCCEQKEQKPVDDKAFEEWINDWWKHNKVNNPDSYDKGDEIQFDEQGFKNFCRGIRNMYQQKPVEWDDYTKTRKIRNSQKRVL